MAKKKPWYWKARKAWYITRDNSQIRLHEDEEEAYRMWHELETLDDPQDDSPVAAILELYLQDCDSRVRRKEMKPATLNGYGFYLGKFAAAHGKRPASELRPFEVNRWVDKPTWGSSSQRLAIASLKAALNWAVCEGILAKNPIAGIKRPRVEKRDVLIDEPTHERIMEATDQPFREFLTALWYTGCRPGTVCKMRQEWVTPDRELWVVPEHKTRGKIHEPLLIPLVPEMMQLTSKLLKQNKTGILFRNSQKKPWTPNAVRCRMKRLREKLGLEEGTVAYAYRHSFTTNALERGLTNVEVAQLLGHKSTRMIDEHYSHLSQRVEHLKEVARRATKRA